MDSLRSVAIRATLSKCPFFTTISDALFVFAYLDFFNCKSFPVVRLRIVKYSIFDYSKTSLLLVYITCSH